MNKFTKTVTLDDVARTAGVSKSTVSYVLSGKKSISKEVCETVYNVIEELGYKPRVSTPRLSRKLKVLCFCIPLQSEGDFGQDSYHLPLLEGAHAAAGEAGYELSIHPLIFNSSSAELFFQNLPLYDGVILGNLWGDHRFRNAVQEAGIPYVYYGSPETEEQDSTFFVDVDVVGAGYQASRYLIEKGHRNIFYVEMSDEMIQSRKHVEGYRTAHEEYGVPWREENLAHARVNMDECQELAGRILGEREEITAFVAVNDVMARGLLLAFMGAGVPVPGKIAVLSMGGTLTARDSIPKLTSVDYHPHLNGRTAVEMLVDVIEKRRLQPSHILIPATMVERDTA